MFLTLDRLTVRDQSGDFERTVELESLPGQDCGDPSEGPFYQMHDGCSVGIPIEFPGPGSYVFEAVADQRRAGDEAARLEISIESEQPTASSEMAIRNKLVELHGKLFGRTYAVDSPSIESTFRLFVEIWDRKRRTEGRSFFEGADLCSIEDHFFFQGIADEILNYDEWDDSALDWDRVGQLLTDHVVDDPHHIARTWAIILAYLLGDYRYVYL